MEVTLKVGGQGWEGIQPLEKWVAVGIVVGCSLVLYQEHPPDCSFQKPHLTVQSQDWNRSWFHWVLMMPACWLQFSPRFVVNLRLLRGLYSTPPCAR